MIYFTTLTFSSLKLKACHLPSAPLRKQVWTCTLWKRLGQPQHLLKRFFLWHQLPCSSGSSATLFFNRLVISIRKLWPVLLTTRLQRLFYTLTFISNVPWILSASDQQCLKEIILFFFFHLTCITRSIECSQRPAVYLLNSCILVFAVNRSALTLLRRMKVLVHFF